MTSSVALICLQVGNLQQRVEVSAAAVQVETTNTQLGAVIDEKNSGPAAQRAQLYRSALDSGGRRADSSATGLISVNGQREASNAFLVNGGDVSEAGRWAPA